MKNERYFGCGLISLNLDSYPLTKHCCLTKVMESHKFIIYQTDMIRSVKDGKEKYDTDDETGQVQ